MPVAIICDLEQHKLPTAVRIDSLFIGSGIERSKAKGENALIMSP